jgi:hypothetical protein
MKVVAAISSPVQNDLIKRILEHIGRRNPPWSRARKARGPPNHKQATAPSRGQAIDTTDSVDPQWDVDAYIVDPPAPEDP